MPERPAEAVPQSRLLLALARLLGDGEAALQVLHRPAQVPATVLQSAEVLVGLQLVRQNDKNLFLLYLVDHELSISLSQ